MAAQLIISIGREFGSGGHEIAEAMAELASHIHNIFGNDVNFHIVID